MFRPVTLLHPASPDSASGAELADLLEEVAVAVKEEAESSGEFVDVNPSSSRCLDVGETVGERERKLLSSGASGFADVIAADGDRMEPGHLRVCVADHVGDDSDARTGRIDVFLLRLIFLEDVVLDRAGELVETDAVLLGDGHIHRQDDRRRTIDRHRCGDAREVDVGE